MSQNTLNLIEPTLFDQTGHGYSYTSSLLSVNNQFNIHTWIDKRGKSLLNKFAVTNHPLFIRKLRKLQKLFLYFKLARKKQIIFISTADYLDLLYLDVINKFIKINATVILHFHQFKTNHRKINKLYQLAKKINFINIFSPTEELIQIFINAGFIHCQVVPCPSFTPVVDIFTQNTFKHILYAGASRADKGFPLVVNYINYLKASGDNTAINLQISTPNSQRYDAETKQALDNIPHDLNNLTLHTNTLDKYSYLQMFRGAVTLLLYNSDFYHDKFSGVALDAFYAAAPIVTTSGTWIAKMVDEYQAGIVVLDIKMATIDKAVKHIINNYKEYANNAAIAGQKLRQKHDPANTLLQIAKVIKK